MSDSLATFKDILQLWRTVNDSLINKVDKIAGKGLSEANYTTEEKNKVATVTSGAEPNVQSNWAETDTASDAYILNKPTIDSALSSTSTNALQNKVIYDAISSITGITFKVVSSLPATGDASIIYLVSNGGSGQNIYDEYIWLTNSGSYEKIGSTDIDLTPYAKISDVNTTLSSYAKTSDMNMALSSYAKISDVNTSLSGKANTSHTHAESDVTNLVSDLAGKASSSHTHAQADITGLSDTLATKQGVLTFDTSPTSGSTNPVTSNGIYSALSGKASTSHTHAESDITNLTTDLAAKANKSSLSTVATSGSYADLSSKPTIPTVDSTLSSTSTNAIQNNIVTNALSGKSDTSHTHDNRYYTETEIDTLRKTDGGNYDSDLISASVNLYSMSLTPNSSYFSGTLKYDANSVIGVLTPASSLSVGTSYPIGTLPSGYRPTSAITDKDSAGNTINISTDGAITITPKAAISSGTAINFYSDY